MPLVLLHNLRSAYNVGAVMRSAAAFGVNELWLTGTTPTPLDRHGRPRQDIAKTALGAEHTLSWQYRSRFARAYNQLRSRGCRLVAVEQQRHAIPLRDLSVDANTCFIFGNEPRGVPSRILSRCDAITEIPLGGRKGSLNVSVAAGIVLYAAGA